MADFGAAHRQLEHGPLVGSRVILGDLIGGPQIAPHVVVLVDIDVVGLHRGARKRDDLGFERLGVDACERRAPRVADPEHIAVLVGAHPARALRPRQRLAVGAIIKGLVELAVLR